MENVDDVSDAACQQNGRLNSSAWGLHAYCPLTGKNLRKCERVRWNSPPPRHRSGCGLATSSGFSIMIQIWRAWQSTRQVNGRVVILRSRVAALDRLTGRIMEQTCNVFVEKDRCCCSRRDHLKIETKRSGILESKECDFCLRRRWRKDGLRCSS